MWKPRSKDSSTLPVEFSRPKRVAFFSLTECKSTLHFSQCCKCSLLTNSSLSLTDYDLNVGIKEYVHEPYPRRETLENIKKALSHFQITPPPRSLISWRGILTKILLMESICEEKEPFWLEVYREGSCVFLQEAQNKRYSKFHPALHWGRAFERAISKPATEGEYCEVFTAVVNGIALIYGAEMDAYTEADEPLELKTCLDDTKAFQVKRPRFWAQCYLVGIEKLLMGFRTHGGKITRIELVDRHEMRHSFDYKKAMVNLHDFCKHLLERMEQEPEGRVISIQFQPETRSFHWAE